MTAQATEQPWRARRPLSRPVRWVVAAAEVAAAVALAAVAVWAWHRASIPVELPEYDNPAIPRTVSRMSGTWAGLSIGAAAVAGALVLDATRQAVLATRAGRRTRIAGTEPPAEVVEAPN